VGALQRGCNHVIQQYLSYLHNQFETEYRKDECIITTPFLDPQGDQIELRARIVDGHLIITDGGLSFDFLFLSGMDLGSKSPIRKYHLDVALNSNRAFILDENEIGIRVEMNEDIGESMHRLVRAIGSVQHLVYTVKGQSVRLFRDEVATYMRENNLSFEPDYVVRGYSKDHRFDFYIPQKQPTVIKALSTENVAYAKRLATDTAFAYTDVRRANVDIRGISLLDDDKPVWAGEALSIIVKYSDKVIKWSHKEELLQIVA
jgi:hypothetical protein